MKTVKKLIEVALPLIAINAASAREKNNPFLGKHPRSIHTWWARRPFVSARAVIFAQMVDDPSSRPDLFPTEKAQEKERARLFKLIEELVQWENTTNETVLNAARDEIWASWRRSCAENADHPRAKELFDRNKLPGFHDPFAGGGALPLEAQRLGLESYASDLNPVAVLINKAMIEIPPRFVGRAPVNPASRMDASLIARQWKGAQGLAEDVRYYGQWVRDEAEKRIGQQYPPIEVTEAMVQKRPDLRPYCGQKLTVIAWLWARTVKSPNPAFARVDVPLASTFMLSTKSGKEAYVEPVIEGNSYRFTVKVGKPIDAEQAKRGTKSGGSGSSFLCLLSGTPMPFEYIRNEARAGRMGSRLMAIVAEGTRGRVYFEPTPEHEAAAESATPEWKPETNLPEKALGFRVQEYGMARWCDLFTVRQLVVLATFSDLVGEAMEQIRRDALSADMPNDPTTLHNGGMGAVAYAETLRLYLTLPTSRWADFSNTLCSWNQINQNLRVLFARHVIPMTWDFAEVNPLGKVGSWIGAVEAVADAFEALPALPESYALQADAQNQTISQGKVIATDPPYYDNVPYADLSDFFYVWMRRSLQSVFPDLFATLSVPKAEELVASPYRHGNKEKAEAFFLGGMTRAMQRLAEQAHPTFPITIYYAFKQSESESDTGVASTGWETFLDAVIQAGFGIYGTWPVRTEKEGRARSNDSNALASSIVLVCRKREATAPIATRRDFITALRNELPTALHHLREGNIAPVDLAQAAIGPGMAVYTRYAKVVDAEGKPVPVREALALINQVLDETLAEQEGDFDADSRFAIAWFEQQGFEEGEFGVADVLARAKVTSVSGLAEAGILESKRGKVRLLKATELPSDWDPSKDQRLTHWEIVHQLIRALESGGEGAAAGLVAKLGSKTEPARELAYRLYSLCERKRRSTEALSYNALVQSWPEVIRLAQEGGQPKARIGELFGEDE